MIQAIVPVSTQKEVMQEPSVEGKSCSYSLYTVVNNCTPFFIDSKVHHQRHKTVVAPPISSMNAASQANYPMSLVFSSPHSVSCKTRYAATAYNGFPLTSWTKDYYIWQFSPTRFSREQDGHHLRELSGKTKRNGNGGSEGVASREGGGGVVGQSHSNSEEEQTTIDGKTDTDGSGQTVNFFHVSCWFLCCVINYF